MQKKNQSKAHIVDVARLTNFKNEVAWLQLTADKNRLEKELYGQAIQARLDAFLDLEINFEGRHPELIPAFIEERNVFIKSVGLEEAQYLEMLAKDKAGRAPKTNPSDQLHAIQEEITGQELAEIPVEKHVLELVPEPAELPSEPVSGNPEEEVFPEPSPNKDE